MFSLNGYIIMFNNLVLLFALRYLLPLITISNPWHFPHLVFHSFSVSSLFPYLSFMLLTFRSVCITWRCGGRSCSLNLKRPCDVSQKSDSASWLAWAVGSMGWSSSPTTLGRATLAVAWAKDGGGKRRGKRIVTLQIINANYKFIYLVNQVLLTFIGSDKITGRQLCI